MINNEMKSVSVISYKEVLDIYGQSRKQVLDIKPVDMMTKIYSQENVTNPKYVNVELIGLTKDNSITTENEIVINDIYYIIKAITPARRFNRILLERK